MADSKITSLTAVTSLASTDLLTAVTDPSGTPANNKITTGNVAASIFAIGSATDVPMTGAGKGLVLTTPDGLHTYRLTIDNDGVVTTEQLT